MQPLPPLRELLAFESAARHLSFRKAADDLSVTPTAISHLIRLLEQFCGQKLFYRQPRPLRLTPAGGRLLPVVGAAFSAMAAEIASIRGAPDAARLRVTTTNAFAARWLVPRLVGWNAEHPGILLDIVGTDAILSLRSGEADVAIRYARTAPPDGISVEILRDRHHMVTPPDLVAGRNLPLAPGDIARLPLIELGWPASDLEAPIWHRWETAARERGGWPDGLTLRPAMRFHEELHGIGAIIAGQGIGLCSDVLVAPELASGALLDVGAFSLPGYGFFVVWRRDHPRQREIRLFVRWACQQSGAVLALPD